MEMSEQKAELEVFNCRWKSPSSQSRTQGSEYLIRSLVRSQPMPCAKATSDDAVSRARRPGFGSLNKLQGPGATITSCKCKDLGIPATTTSSTQNLGKKSSRSSNAQRQWFRAIQTSALALSRTGHTQSCRRLPETSSPTLLPTIQPRPSCVTAPTVELKHYSATRFIPT